MNIFFLDKDPEVAARMQVNKSLVKMCLETAQLLSGALRYHGATSANLYKMSHVNHPSAIWARRSSENFAWLANHGLALCEEYAVRYPGKTHKSLDVIWHCFELMDDYIPLGPLTIEKEDLAVKSTDAGLQALEKFKGGFDDAVHVYREFYAAKEYVIKSKVSFA